jgi:hypothetical protein
VTSERKRVVPGAGPGHLTGGAASAATRVKAPDAPLVGALSNLTPQQGQVFHLAELA